MKFIKEPAIKLSLVADSMRAQTLRENVIQNIMHLAAAILQYHRTRIRVLRFSAVVHVLSDGRSIVLKKPTSAIIHMYSCIVCGFFAHARIYSWFLASPVSQSAELGELQSRCSDQNHSQLSFILRKSFWL